MIAPAQDRVRRVAFVGNPNTGKTTLFNALTGLSQRVANYPGVTVERKLGQLAPGLEAVDLPGTYSLSAHSPDELVAVRCLSGDLAGEARPDLAVVVVDAANLHRNLYLLTQVLEVGLPVVVALNRVDAAEAAGVRTDAAGLSRALGVPVVPTVATRGVGLPELRAEIRRRLDAPAPQPPWPWPEQLADEFSALTRRFRGGFLLQRALLDEGGLVEETLVAREGPALRDALAESRARLRAGGSHPAELETRLRYGWIGSVVETCVQRRPTGPALTDRLDAVLTHRVFGLLIFAIIMTAMFLAIFEGAAPFMEAIRSLCGWLAEQLTAAFAGTRLAGGALESLLVHGVLAGVGGILIFLPQVFFLFLFLALLEDCGYLARAAFLMDRALRFCGLSGHSFIPLMSCYACAVPGILATRTIADPRDRLATILVAPLMSCSARIPVYTLMIAAFVPPLTVGGVLPLQGVVFAGLYFLGILVAIPAALLLKRFVLRGPDAGFVLELPIYTRPTFKNVAWRVWEGVRAFVVRAGSVIFAISILIWALSYFPRPAAIGAEYDGLRAHARQELRGSELDRRLAQLDQQEAGAYLRQSFFGRAGQMLEPLVRPLGWDGRIGMAVLASFPAREVVVSTLQIVYDLGEKEGERANRAALIGEMRAARWPDGRRIFTLPVALSLVIFFALCCQCGATLAVIRRETHSWRWPAFAFAYLTALAYLGALLTYQVGTALSGL